MCIFHEIHIGGFPFTTVMIHKVQGGYRFAGSGKEGFTKILTLRQSVCLECAKEPLSAVALKVSSKFKEGVNQKRVSAGKKPL